MNLSYSKELQASKKLSSSTLIQIQISMNLEHAELNPSALLMTQWTLCETFPASEPSPRLTRPSGSISGSELGGEANKKLSDIYRGRPEPVNPVTLKGDLPLLTHGRLMRLILFPAPRIICQYSFRLCWTLPALLSFDVLQILSLRHISSSWQTVQEANIAIII